MNWATMTGHHVIKALRARRHRDLMTPDELATEQLRLIDEAREMAEARGLSTAGIGDRWTRDPLELNTDGQRVTRASVRAEEAEKKNAEESAEMEDVL